MRPDPLHMLKRLNPPIRPMGAERAHGRAPIESRGFDELLTLLASGELQGETPVETVSVTGAPLDAAQQRRLAGAADLAEEAGFRQALILMDERSFILDIQERRLIEESTGASADRVLNVDGAVRVATGRAESSAPRDPRRSIMPAPVSVRHFGSDPFVQTRQHVALTDDHQVV